MALHDNLLGNVAVLSLQYLHAAVTIVRMWKRVVHVTHDFINHAQLLLLQ